MFNMYKGFHIARSDAEEKKTGLSAEHLQKVAELIAVS
jgi:hypothetical protein